MRNICIVLMLLLSIGIHAQETKPLIEVSKKVLGYMQKNEFASIEPFYDETMKQALPASKLKEVWTSIQAQVGAYEKYETITTANESGYRVVYILCNFKSKQLKLKLVYDKNDKIAGMFFLP